MRPTEWKEGEILYLRRLLASHGNADVSSANIASYLATQGASAYRMGHKGLAEILAAVHDMWDEGKWETAREILECLA